MRGFSSHVVKVPLDVEVGMAALGCGCIRRGGKLVGLDCAGLSARSWFGT